MSNGPDLDVYIAEYYQLILKSQAAYNAAIQAAWKAKEAEPQTFWDHLSAAITYTYERTFFHDTPLARQRLIASVPKHALIGARAYVNGQRGNYYTAFLIQMFGPFQY